MYEYESLDLLREQLYQINEHSWGPIKIELELKERIE
jgi:hypothetical protein